MSEASTAPRWKILLPLLLGTLALVAWLEVAGEGEEEEVAAAVVRPRQPGGATDRPPATAPVAQDAAPARELKIDRAARTPGAVDGRGGDPFARIDWNPPAPKPAAPPPVVAAAPPRPVAPPIPYSYFGMSIQDGRTVVFVTRQDRTFVLAAGEVIENTYRVEEIRATEVVLTYIPLNERQVMTIGTAKP
ncbi:MAG: hypothetical protein ACK515_24775 [bacterium]